MADYRVTIDLDPQRLGEPEEGRSRFAELGDVFAARGMVWRDGVATNAPDLATAVLAVQDAARQLAWFGGAVTGVRLLQDGEESDLMPIISEAASDRRGPSRSAIGRRRRSRAEGGFDIRRRDFLVLAVLLAAAMLVSVALIRGPGAVKGPGNVVATRSSAFDGLLMPTPWRQTPPLALDSYLGQPVNIDSYRGKVVFVTFLYVHCPNVCPIIASKLHDAEELMSPSEKREVRLIAVSVDPRGDTPTAVAQFLAARGLVGQMQYLIGTLDQLAPVWKHWHVSSSRSDNPDVVDHTALVYGVTASGRLATIYQSTFSPQQIIHDIPLLASQ